MHKKIIIITLFIALFAPFLLISNDSNSALRMILKRVVLEGGKRAENLTLINSSDEQKTYRLEWRQMVMTPDDGLMHVDKADLPENVKPSSDFIRYSPRRVTIPPRSTQIVRLALRMPAGVEDGEYRSHLWVRQEVNPEKLRRKYMEENPVAEGKFGIGVTMLPGVTLPVIVRKGNLDARLNIEEAFVKIQGGEIQTAMNLVRSGNKSTYGDLDFICNPEGEAYALSSRSGIAVYTELDSKKVSFNLKMPENEKPCKSMLIRYTEMDNFNGDPVEVMDEVVVPVR